MQLLSPDELNAVIAHELSHIANRDALVMSVVGMPSAVMRRSTAGGLGAVFVVMIGIVAEVGTTTLSRYRELAADAGSAAITGHPSALASALMKVSDGLTRVPSRDLREAAALNSFNLVAVQPPGTSGGTRSRPACSRRTRRCRHGSTRCMRSSARSTSASTRPARSGRAHLPPRRPN